MIKVKQQRGFGLLATIIAISTIVTLGIIILPLISHFGWQLIVTKKIKTSINLLHEAANNYYYNEIIKNRASQTFTAQDLITEGYLKATDIFQYNETDQNLSKYKYEVGVQQRAGKQYYVIVSVETKTDLHGLSPNVDQLACSGQTAKCYVRKYEWFYPVSLDAYNNVSTHSIIRSVAFDRHVVDT